MIKRIVAVAVVAAMAGSAAAEPISIDNASFEMPEQDVGAWTNELPDWSGPDDEANAFIEYIDGFSADGVNHLGIQNGEEVSQDLGVGLVPNMIYNLTVAIGNRNANFTPEGAESIYGIYVGGDLADGGTLVADKSFDPFPQGEGTFVDDTLSFTTGETVPDGNMVISLRTGDTGRAHFDNVRLEVVPEPAGAILALCGVLGLLRLRRK